MKASGIVVDPAGRWAGDTDPLPTLGSGANRRSLTDTDYYPRPVKPGSIWRGSGAGVESVDAHCSLGDPAQESFDEAEVSAECG